MSALLAKAILFLLGRGRWLVQDEIAWAAWTGERLPTRAGVAQVAGIVIAADREEGAA